MEPFLKWAGGKRWLARSSEFQVPSFSRLIEPFLGGGAIFFQNEPARALLSDVNGELINLYVCIREKPEQIDRALRRLQKGDAAKAYYAVRGSKPLDPVSRAVRTLYLNRTCWNGLYRLNRNGQFNVPRGTKNRFIFETDDFFRASEVLQCAILEVCDFEKSINSAEAGDLIFADPPYTVKHNMNGFVKYNESIFSWSDQIRLRDACARAARRGASVIVTNADHESVRDLYKGVAAYRPLVRSSVLAGKSRFRGNVSEALFSIIP